MKIIVFSLGVVFKNTVQGGSQKVLRDISKNLAYRGHEITIVCPRREDNNEIFEFCHGAVVKPILPLRGAFPMPYDVPPFSLVETYRIMKEELKNADILYCHDGGLLIESLKEYIPVVISLRDFCYQETLLGSLNFKGTSVVVNSMHTMLCIQDSIVQINPFLEGKIKLIYNGYDSELFCRKEISDRFLKQYGLCKKNEDLIIGFPHRPEMSKGFLNALQVLKRLTGIWGERVKLLIPIYMDCGMSGRTDNTYSQTKTMIDDMGLQNNVIYHKWVRHEDMPEYYSVCDVILCIGNFVESFSNVSIEALLCGTPVVSSNTSTYRTMPIRQFLNIVPYGAIEETTRVVQNILSGGGNDRLKEAREYISKELTIVKMVDAYEQIFLQATKEKGSKEKTIKTNKLEEKSKGEDTYKLAAWCEVIDGKIYNDYRGEFLKDIFKGVFSTGDERYTKRELFSLGINAEMLERAILDGILVIGR